jgi:cell division transport system permease protein
VIETLSLNGATDGSIAWLFQRRFGLLAAGAGAIGAGLAAALLVFLRFLGGSDGLTSALPISWSDLALLSPCPLLAATVAVLAARFAAMRVLGSTG